MLLTRACQVGPLSLPMIGTPHDSNLKAPLLYRRPSSEAPNSKYMAPIPDTKAMSLDQWVAFEEKHCAKSGAREAARRIKDVQRGGLDVLELISLHLHTVPPLVRCQHVTTYWLTGNCLGRVPSDVGDLPNLITLGIHTNDLREIPSFDKYTHLKLLGISGNPVCQIPRSLQKRRVAVIDVDTLVTPSDRKRYRQNERRRKLREFVVRWCPGMPDIFLPSLDESTPSLSPKCAKVAAQQ